MNVTASYKRGYEQGYGASDEPLTAEFSSDLEDRNGDYTAGYLAGLAAGFRDYQNLALEAAGRERLPDLPAPEDLAVTD